VYGRTWTGGLYRDIQMVQCKAWRSRREESLRTGKKEFLETPIFVGRQDDGSGRSQERKRNYIIFFRIYHNFYILDIHKYSVTSENRLNEIHTRLMKIAQEERDLLNERKSIQSQMFKSKLNMSDIIDGIGHG